MGRRYNTLILLALLVLSSCTSTLPRSGGKPSEVVVIAPSDITAAVVAQEMEQLTEQYTTAEPMFIVRRSVGAGREDINRLARTIILVEIADVPETQVIRETNLWAAPQLVLYVRTPGARRLSHDIKTLRHTLARAITSFERTLAIQDIRRHSNRHLSDSIKKYVGCTMDVPARMKIARAADGYIWLNDNNSDNNSCISLYTLPRAATVPGDIHRLTVLRDSIMQRYIKGSAPGVRFQIVPGTERLVRDDSITIIRNQWQMHGDAMGGPATCRIITKGETMIIAEAFIYSPSTPKRDKMRRAEASLFTIKTDI